MAVAEFTTLLIYNYPGAHKANCSLSCMEQIQTPCLVTCMFGETGVSNPQAYKWKANQTSNFFLVHEAEMFWTPKQITQVCFSRCLLGWIHTTTYSTCQRYKAGSSHNLARWKQCHYNGVVAGGARRTGGSLLAVFSINPHLQGFTAF